MTDIAYDTAPAGPGSLLLAATERGVCYVSLGTDAGELLEGLRREYPTIDLVRDPARVRPWLDDLVARVAAGAPGTEPPLDLRGTPFQLRVWDALRAIPFGETRTYGEIAASFGNPGMARAVGAAVAANRVAVLVPCHRAVHAGGKSAGFRWGLDWKRRLLESERK